LNYLLVLCAALLMACSTQLKRDESKYGASVGIVNHTEKYIDSASVNGAGGANMGAWGAGIGNVCCASVPRKWYPGMNVLVRWDMPEGSKHYYKEKMVEVEKYDEPGTIYLHFFPNECKGLTPSHMRSLELAASTYGLKMWKSSSSLAHKGGKS
jgi:hypothetical protein